jgi:hypothetical protein
MFAGGNRPTQRRSQLKNAMDAQYSSLPAGGFLDKVLNVQRRRLFDAFMEFKKSTPDGSILDIGGMPATMLEGSDFLQEWTDPNSRSAITSCRIGSQTGKIPAHANDAQTLRKVDIWNLPYADGEFDWVFCNETIERVGGFERQYELLKEMMRVSRRGIFVTTSNRWYPMEFYTARPLLHWLPDSWWRRILKLSGKGAWASESVLSLLDADGLKELTNLLPGKPKAEIGHIRLFGIKAHFFLQIKKAGAQRTDD